MTTSFPSCEEYDRDNFTCPLPGLAAQGRIPVLIMSAILDSRIYSSQIQKQNKSLFITENKYNILTVVCESTDVVYPSHPEFSPQQDLTLRPGSIQMEPLVQDQLWLCKQLLHGDHQRSHWLIPATGQLQ